MASPRNEPGVPRRRDRSPLNWLLVIPIVVPLLVPFFNAHDPKLLGFPRFYWLQLAFILVGVVTTTVVYQLTKRRG
jgi:ABC-type transport system involved in cytochrome c biogenesis permease component